MKCKCKCMREKVKNKEIHVSGKIIVHHDVMNKMVRQHIGYPLNIMIISFYRYELNS